MVPDRLLVHDVVVVRPATSTDAYGDVELDYGASATRTSIRAWLQQDQRDETFRDGRAPLDQRWLLVTNETDVAGRDRIEWADHPAGSVTFEVDGPPEPAYTGAGLHHLEAGLRVVEG